MSIKINIPTPMRQHTAGNAVVEVPGGTVQAVFDALGQEYPDIRQAACTMATGLGQLPQRLSQRMRHIRYLDNLTTAVKDGRQKSALFPPWPEADMAEPSGGPGRGRDIPRDTG